MMPGTTTTTSTTFSAVEATEKLSEFHKAFTEAAAGPDRRLAILARRIETLQRIFHRLQVSLQQTKRPFIGYDGFQKTLLACGIFIQCFNPPSNSGYKWFCSDHEIEARDTEIETEISFLTTSIIVLLAETYFSNDDREPGAVTYNSRSFAFEQVQPSTDPEIEQFEQFWADIWSLVYSRKRKPLRDSPQSPVPKAHVREEVENNLRRLLLNGAKLIPGAILDTEPKDLQTPQTKQKLRLEELSNKKLLEINQQQERFGRTASQKRPLPTAAQFERTDYFSAPSRAWTVESESELSHSSQRARLPPIEDGVLFLGNAPPYRLASIECRVIDAKRKVICRTIDHPQIKIIHDCLYNNSITASPNADPLRTPVPAASKRYPRTVHPKMVDASTPHVDFPERLEVKINSVKLTNKAHIKYLFTKPGSLKAFQSMIREKDLIETFCVDEVESAQHRIEAVSEHLKVWKDRTTEEYTFSIFRNGSAKQHLEFSLSWFQLRQPRNQQLVRLEYVGEPAPRRNSAQNPDAGASSSSTTKRGSISSCKTTKAEDKAANAARHREQLRNAAASIDFLLIKFSTKQDADDFRVRHKDALDNPPKGPPKDTISTLGSEGSTSPSPDATRRKSRSSSDSRSEPPSGFELAQIGSQFQPVGLGIMPVFRTLVDPFLDALTIRLSSTSLSESTSMVHVENVQRTYRDYTVGWICALHIEFAAAMTMLDEVHQGPPNHMVDENAYEFGRIGRHNVVIGCLPEGMMGTISATTVAQQMRFAFPSIAIRLMVGIGGGVPSATNDIRLGDVVVSKPGPRNSGVVQYDFGKKTGNGFEPTGHLPSPPAALLTVVSRLQARHAAHGNQISNILEAFDSEHRRAKFGYPGAEFDELFEADYNHVKGEETCTKCDRSRLQRRPPRQTATLVHYGTIGSGNSVMKDAITRDELGQQHGVLCFEMEAAGLMRSFPCLVIRGISDYSDTHKHKEWQGYAAAAAAAYAKELLLNA